MTIRLKPDPEKGITEAIQTGAHRDSEEVIDQALARLHDQDDWLSEEKEEISERIERAFAHYERGEFYTAGRPKAEMARRKAEWLRNRQ